MLILMLLSNSFFNFFMKMKTKSEIVFRFPFFYENGKQMRVLKIQSKNLLNMKIVVASFEVKTKSNKILNFVFQFIKNTKWHFGYKDWATLLFSLVINHLFFNFFTNHVGTSVELITILKPICLMNSWIWTCTAKLCPITISALQEKH